MAKAILEQMLKARGQFDGFEVDSAAYDGPTCAGASKNASEAIKRLFGDDLLASHKAKKLTPELVERAHLILVSCQVIRGSPLFSRGHSLLTGQPQYGKIYYGAKKTPYKKRDMLTLRKSMFRSQVAILTRISEY